MTEVLKTVYLNRIWRFKRDLLLFTYLVLLKSMCFFIIYSLVLRTVYNNEGFDFVRKNYSKIKLI